ncbi:MAG: class I SAM-dependent RNA methyltransferase [Leptonema sp. (in: Bacteria)]|nr:class I SAM-dependent RNA methyltransferase [Leptonema sp. (in: bacteria)]
MSNTHSKITVKIEKWVQNGLTIAHYQDRPIFVHGALPNEIVEIEIKKELKGYSFGQTVRVIESAVNRLESDCSIFPECGGCSFRHISYEEELNLKTSLLAEHQSLSPYLHQFKLFSGQANGYRHHSRLHQQNHKVGFFSLWTEAVVSLPYNGCRQLAPELNNALKNNSVVDTDFSLYLNSNQKIINAPITKDATKSKKLMNQDKLEFKIDDFKWQYRRGQFFQSNRFLIPSWLQYIESLIPEQGLDTVELFCGTGIIGGFVRQKLGSYLGIESVGSSLNEARQNFTDHKLTGKFQLRDLYQPKGIAGISEIKASLLIVNPPRAGLKSPLCQEVAKSNFNEIIYSSCNPATLNRDLFELSKVGFQLTNIAGFDFFPRTPHIEIVVKLSKK